MHASLVSSQADVKALLESKVKGLPSGVLVQVSIPAMLLAEQSFAEPPLHTPAPLQVSPTLQNNPSLQVVPSVLNVLSGQSLFVPSHDSATSQAPSATLHTLVNFASAGHAALEPVHDSALSRTPALALHVVEDDLNVSAGQVALEPVHDSALSQSPADALHTFADDK